MKTIIVMLAVIVAFTSCEKEYTCRCDGGAFGGGANITVKGKTKEDAQKECESNSSSATFGLHNCRLQ